MKIDSEKPYNNNFSEEIKPQMTIQDEYSITDNEFSPDENITKEKNIYRDDIYDVKIITEIKIPDKVVISENIIKDVCIDEGIIKMDLNVKKEISDETDDAFQTVHEKEICIEEIADEKISLKDLFHSEDKKMDLNSSKKVEKASDNKETITQGTMEDFLDTSTNGPEIPQPDMPSNPKNAPNNDDNNIILEEASLSIPSSIAPNPDQIKDPDITDEELSLDPALGSVQLCDDDIENRAHHGQEIFYDGPKITARKSLSQSYGRDINVARSVANSEPKGSSAHLAYSGSISMRSDSSTTSARSFAFPILQSEWNSSPVKMAKANRRRFWKSRGWRSNIWCCSFQN